MKNKSSTASERRWKLSVAFTLLAGTLTFATAGVSAETARYFPETGKSVSDRFLEYWDANGGLAQQGFPVSEEMQETSSIDGQVYTVQYFERAVFEKHSENPAPYDVLLSLLGATYYNENYGGDAPGQVASSDNPITFDETGKTIGGTFRTYWEDHGGLAQQGFPISDEFQETSSIDGNTYTVQYYERAVFEYHPEFAGTENEVQLSLLGAMTLNSMYPDGPPEPTFTAPQPTLTGAVSPPPSGTAIFARPGWTHVVATTNNIVVFANQFERSVATARIEEDGTLTPLLVYPDSQNGRLDVPHEFSIVVAGPNNWIYFYEPYTGRVFYIQVNDDGSLGQNEGTIGQWRDAQWATNWTHIVSDLDGRMFVFYDSVRGTLLTARANDDGSGTDLYFNDDPNQQTWDQFAPLGNGMWFAYIVSGDVGAGLTLRLNDDGTFTFLYPYYNLAPDWTHIVADGSHMLFYSQSSRSALTSSIGADGVLTDLQTFDSWGANWNAAATKNGVIIFYDTATGMIVTDRINDDGSYTDLVTYAP